MILPIGFWVIAVVFSIRSVIAAPRVAVSEHGTHRFRELEHGVRVVAYHPNSIYETFGEGVDHPLSKRGIVVTPKDAALSFLSSRLDVDVLSLSYQTGYSSEAAHHVYIKQTINGIDITNAVANVALGRNDKVVAFGASFVKVKSVSSSTPKLTAGEAISKAETYLNGKWNDFPTKLEYFALDTDHVVLTYLVQIQNDDHWFQASVDAHSGEVINVVDFVAHASYLVIPFTLQNPTDGFQVVVDPEDPIASPLGWTRTATTNYTSTRGNNVVAYKSVATNTAPQSSPSSFIYPWDPSLPPTAPGNLNAARVNAFYVGNMVHDLTYRYGFTEVAGNFQATNNPGVIGGRAGDAINLSIQDSSGTNNANFASPPDGQPGICRLFAWTYTTPGRDSALENDIITHEFTHGVTSRLTGGGTGTCLQTTEASGMGEGWSDSFTSWVEQNSAVIRDFTLGSWITNTAAGIRSYPYSTSAVTNPLRYSSLATRTEVHDIGEVWANTLYNVYAALVAQYGWTKDIFNPSGTGGNIVMFHLFIDGLALQPCNPTFITARNAMIQADANRYGGVNKCLLWKAFASKGLGYGATSARVDSNTLPSGC